MSKHELDWQAAKGKLRDVRKWWYELEAQRQAVPHGSYIHQLEAMLHGMWCVLDYLMDQHK